MLWVPSTAVGRSATGKDASMEQVSVANEPTARLGDPLLEQDAQEPDIVDRTATVSPTGPSAQSESP